MWLNNKTPAEIDELFEKEGIIPKLLKKVKQFDELAEEREPEPVTTEEERSFLALDVKQMLLSFVSGIRPPKNTKEIKGFSVQSKRHEVGDVILYLMAMAMKKILVTHLFYEVYSEMYRTVQQEKISEGIVFERLVLADLVYSTGYKFLTDFFNNKGTPFGNYQEHIIVTSWQFNFDFMIIDDKYIILVQRGGSSDEVLVFENDSMVKIFLCIWENLKSQVDGNGNPSGLPNNDTPTQEGRGIQNNPTPTRLRTKGNL